MTNPDDTGASVGPATPSSTTTGASASPKANVAALSGVAIGVLLWVLLIMVKITAVVISNAQADVEALTQVFGVLGLLTIIVALVAVVLGHVGLAGSKRTGKGRATAGIALALGYTQIVLWLFRIVVAIIATAGADAGSSAFSAFLDNIFYWA
jgi:hypothetical protein